MFDLLGVDWGEKRCGVAFGSSATGLVVPYKDEITNSQIMSFLFEKVNEKNIQVLVIGIPTTLQLKPTQTTQKIGVFVQELKQSFPSLKIIQVNERGTTQSVRAKFGRENPRSKTKIDRVDNLAAAEILRIYLDDSTAFYLL